MKKKYIGLTIGPIYRTLQNAKKTRELWAGSYIFSYLMKQIIQELKDREFIIPYVDCGDHDFSELLMGKMPIGVFHDRMIFRSQNNVFEELQVKIDGILKHVSHQITQLARADFNPVFEYVKAYLQLYFCEAEYDENADHKEINADMNKRLDCLELQTSFIPQEGKNYVTELLSNVNRSFLVQEAFEDFKRFRSIPEIAVASLGLGDIGAEQYCRIFETFEEKDNPEDDDIYRNIVEKYPTVKDAVRPYHKYIAIVHADGDNLGTTISGLNSNDDFKRLSKCLFDFALAANEKIVAFGGETIFAGGDDLLFFAPVVNQGKSVFALLDQLDDAFNHQFQWMGTGAKPTLSFGVSISYYKFPLYEALDISRTLLLESAKKIGPNKNAVAFRVLKHSGQFFEGVVEKGSDIHTHLKEMLDHISPVGDGGRLMTSIIHHLFAQRVVLDEIGQDEKRLENFFQNNFDEAVHRSPQNDQQMKSIRRLISAVFASGIYADKEKRARNIYSLLRLNKFIRE